MSSIIQKPISGMRDFYPYDMINREWLFDIWNNICRSFNFSKYDGPIIERTQIWKKKNDDSDNKKIEDDIIKEMFTFTVEITDACLRPEMTPSLVRMIMGTKDLYTPIRWYSIGNCFRKETVSKGRTKEFVQLNCDIIAGENIKSELELLAINVNIFKKLGFTSNEICIKISHRALIQQVTDYLELPFDNICNIIDKLNKKTEKEILEILLQSGLCDTIKAEILMNFVAIRDIPGLLDFFSILDLKNKEPLEEIIEIFNLSQIYNIIDWLMLDTSIVRGLSYYTGMVFEAFSKIPNTINRSISGGGRYDNLMKNFGCKNPQKCVGFAMGDVVILELLNNLKRLKQPYGPDYCIIPYDESFYNRAINISNRLREKGYSVDLYMKKTKVRIAYNYANNIKARYAIIIASEYDLGIIKVKDMFAHEEIEYNIESFFEIN